MAADTVLARLANHTLPLVLAGPILRAVDLDKVTVWVALRESQPLELRVYQGGSAAGNVVLTGSQHTVQIGDHLHVAAVTADGGTLLPEQLYSYDLTFDNLAKLDDAGVLKLAAGGLADLAYPGTTHPTFSVPPVDMGDLRLVHGSCRKPHAPGHDALPALDLIIADAATTPATFARDRPHHLFLTGDQIYADDVGDALLHALTEAGLALLGWEETLPVVAKSPSALGPGTRQATAAAAKLTSTEAKSHLLGLGEFYSMYLFAWADVVWPSALETVGPQEERDALVRFKAGLPAVRRALANVPTYMIFDDHEITDDWFMNHRWCESGVPAKEPGGAAANDLGRRVVLNGLVAYALFQGWGNTPERFSAFQAGGLAGEALLTAAADWSTARGVDTPGTAGAAALAELTKRVGLAPALGKTDATFTRSSDSVLWHYRVAPPGRAYEVVVLDSRTMRFYDPATPSFSPSGLLSPAAFTLQLDTLPAPPATDGVTIVVAPAPVFGVPWIEERQATTGEKVFEDDAEAWGMHAETFQRFIGWAASRRRAVTLLSGDVHYAFVASCTYSATQPYRQAVRPAVGTSVIAQLTSSALHNESTGLKSTERQHYGGYNQLYVIKTGRADDVIGWNVPPTLAELSIAASNFYPLHNIHRTAPALLHHVDHRPPGSTISKVADWRYRVRWLPGAKATTTAPPTPLTSFAADEAHRAAALRKFQEDYRNTVTDRGGIEIVGHNNIAELRFSWPAGAGKHVTQRLWWAPVLNAPAAPLTTHVVSLDLPPTLPLTL